VIKPSKALASLPVALRDPLLAEYQSLVQGFLERRWLPSELSGGRFSEVVYTVLDGHAKNHYAVIPIKPSNFVQACQKLETNTQSHVPRSFRILIPRMLPSLYEIRNNRNVGHIGGDVDSNQMDSVAVVSMCNWIMGELVRVYHGLEIAEAQTLVDALAQVRTPLVWSGGDIKRVLQASLSLPDQLLILIGTTLPSVSIAELLSWSEAPDHRYFMRLLRGFHKKRFIELSKSESVAQILPPGSSKVEALVRKELQRTS